MQKGGRGSRSLMACKIAYVINGRPIIIFVIVISILKCDRKQFIVPIVTRIKILNDTKKIA